MCLVHFTSGPKMISGGCTAVVPHAHVRRLLYLHVRHTWVLLNCRSGILDVLIPAW
jgi:hypothetical protein